ncbi:aspartate/glutamate racemase family protein [Marmoricola sp. RAF53]|uniref:aspartate/glutamate racemase family protein n=1 Tax=Marmoricola sp. RAF53 TaxID=3233059 RepID=UPI003F9B33CD
MPTIGFLHTSPVHIPTFDALVHGDRPGVGTIHLVDESLLERARDSGPDAVREAVAAQLARLHEEGADVLVCTCSTIGPVAEETGPAGVTTFRVDRPMARAAVVAGGRVGVVAAVESTLEPTRVLLEQEALAAGAEPEIDLVLADGAWDLFEAGQHAAYVARVAAAARDLAGRVDVVVLAQASAAPAARLLEDGGVRVLSSPASAVRHAFTLLPDR